MVLSLSKYWCKFGRMLFVDDGSAWVIGTGMMVGFCGIGTLGSGGGLVLAASDDALVSSEPEYECELHCEQESEQSDSGKVK